MGLTNWLKDKNKMPQNNLEKSEDFRTKKPFVEPQISFWNATVAFPYIGAIKGYYIVLVALFLLYLIFKSPIIGILAGLNILLIVAWEFYVGSKTTGVKTEIKDTIMALLLGVIIWFGSGYFLNTSTPINAIVSCSMLPAYERGDMLLLQGADVNTKYLQYSGPTSDFELGIAQISYNKEKIDVNGSLYSYCQTNPRMQMCLDFFKNPSDFTETHGPIELKYGICIKQNVKNAQKKLISCVKHTYYNGQEIEFSKDHDLIVYTPRKTDIYSYVGDIVHRARFAINCTDGVLYFTKGDNNPIYDFQIYVFDYKMGNAPILQNQIKGKNILRIPYLGNFKLFIAPQVLLMGDESTGCDSYISE